MERSRPCLSKRPRKMRAGEERAKKRRKGLKSNRENKDKNPSTIEGIEE